VTTIEDYAFSGNALKSITIGANVKLGPGCFAYGFDSYYNNNGKKAGIYGYRWGRQGGEWRDLEKERRKEKRNVNAGRAACIIIGVVLAFINIMILRMVLGDDTHGYRSPGQIL
jgi:hypothetical protein